MKWQILVDGQAIEIDSEHLDAVAEVEPDVLFGDSRRRKF